MNILSHQPWKVSSEELKGLKSYWTLPELAEVAVVVVHYNKLCIIEESLNIRKNVVLVETSFDNGVDDSTQESLMKQIEEKIRCGVYQPGERLQSESEMAKSFGVSIITVRSAVSGLVEKGLVEKKQGKGTFVTKPKFSRNILKDWISIVIFNSAIFSK